MEDLIQGKYRIRRFDEWNLVLEELLPEREAVHDHLHLAKDGKYQEKWIIRGYFGRLDAVFSYIISHIPEEDLNKIKTLSERIEEIREEMSRLNVGDLLKIPEQPRKRRRGITTCDG